ncbi:MAG: hypothetical protein WCF54_08745 [Terracidiphilus sp.]
MPKPVKRDGVAGGWQAQSPGHLWDWAAQPSILLPDSVSRPHPIA